MRDHRVIMLEDCMDSMDGRDFHDAAIKIMRRIIGQVMMSDELIRMMDEEEAGAAASH